jgi:hypothetical protein
VSLKGIAVLFVALALLFACSLVLGAASATGQVAEMPPPAVKALAGLLVRDRPLTADDVERVNITGCLQQFQQGAFFLPQGATCLFVVGDSGRAVRSLSLGLVQGSEATASLEPAGDQALPARFSLNGGSPGATLQLFEDGGTLTIACAAAGVNGLCQLQVEQ